MHMYLPQKEGVVCTCGMRDSGRLLQDHSEIDNHIITRTPLTDYDLMLMNWYMTIFDRTKLLLDQTHKIAVSVHE